MQASDWSVKLCAQSCRRFIRAGCFEIERREKSRLGITLTDVQNISSLFIDFYCYNTGERGKKLSGIVWNVSLIISTTATAAIQQYKL